MRIAVDASLLASATGGLGRYLEVLLRRMLTASSAHDWLLYGRQNLALPTHAPSIRLRHDSWPPDAGRIASLATSVPLWLAQDRPDVFWAPAHRFPLWIPANTARVLTIHDLCWLRVPESMRASTRWLDATLMPRAVAQADRVVAVSEATGADLRAVFPAAAERVVVVPAAAESLPAPGAEDALRAIGIASPYLLFVGTREPRKNLARLVRAFAMVCERFPQLQLVIAGGDGWGSQREFDALLATPALAARIKTTGRVDDRQLATLYAHALCLAMPSLYEGFGLPLLEAMAQGTPAITSTSSSMPEVGGDAATLVDPTSVDSIAQAIVRMMEEPGLREALAARARTQAARFSWDRAAATMLQVFEDAQRHRAARR
jgi:glycosyltransferase involved in cell wall biosynthesis